MATGIKILFLEDDILYQESIKDFLEEHHFIIETCKNGEQFLESIFNDIYDLYIIDLNVPLLNGYQVMELLKTYNDPTMKLVLTSSPNGMVQSFKSGCDDYVNKTNDISELLLRIKNLIKRAYGTHSECIQLTDNIKYNIFHKKVYQNEQLVELESRALLILDCLIRNRGNFISSAEVENCSYPSSSESKSNVLRYHIWHIRNILGKEIIESKKNLGYKLHLFGN